MPIQSTPVLWGDLDWSGEVNFTALAQYRDLCAYLFDESGAVVAQSYGEEGTCPRVVDAVALPFASLSDLIGA